VDAQRILFLGEDGQLWSDLLEQLNLMGIEAERHDTEGDFWGRESRSGVFAVLLGPSIQGKKRLDLCRRSRSTIPCPIVVISESIEEAEELRLVSIGVCDIVYLPLRPRVLAAKLANWAGHTITADSERKLLFANLELSLVEHWVTVDGAPVNLTRTEFDLLALLMDNPRRVYTHEELSRWIWHDPWTVDHHRLEAHVCRLRKKITKAGGPAIVASIRGVGYRLLVSADMSSRGALAG